MALIDGLVSYWKLDETSGQRNDSHGANHLTDINTVASATGIINLGADFERANSECLKVAHDASLAVGGNQDFTISAWFSQEDYGQGVCGLVQKHTDNSSANLQLAEYTVYLYFGIPRFAVGNNTIGVFVSWPQITDAALHVLVAWYSSSDQKVYIQIDNGTPAEEPWTGGTLAGSNAFYIGGYESGSEFGDGVIDEVGFWKRVLTTQERTQLWNGGAGLPYSSFGAANNIRRSQMLVFMPVTTR